jgi:hypothetical protein
MRSRRFKQCLTKLVSASNFSPRHFEFRMRLRPTHGDENGVGWFAAIFVRSILTKLAAGLPAPYYSARSVTYQEICRRTRARRNPYILSGLNGGGPRLTC